MKVAALCKPEAGTRRVMIVDTARAAADLFEPLLKGRATERMVAAHLDRERRLLRLVEEAPGSSDAVEVPVRSVLVEAIRLGSVGLVLGHNHPSGDPSPSEADRIATRLLSDAARGIGITLHDHLIYAAGEWRSFRALGLL